MATWDDHGLDDAYQKWLQVGLSIEQYNGLKPLDRFNLQAQYRQELAQRRQELSNARIERKLDDLATDDQSMSEASFHFTLSLLGDMGIEHHVPSPNEETGEGELQQDGETQERELQKYPWGEKEPESDGQEACRKILQRAMSPLVDAAGCELGMYDIRNHKLLPVKAGRRKSSGFSDIAVGRVGDLRYAFENAEDSVLDYVVALVELKTGKAALKKGQLLLQLVSLSRVSQMHQGVVVMGTDCADKWRLLHFSGYNTIVVQNYVHGKKCVADFKKLLKESKTRNEHNVAPKKLSSVPEGSNAAGSPEGSKVAGLPSPGRGGGARDMELDLAEFGVETTDRDKAIEREAYLRKLAGVLGSLYGETLEVPSWARASDTCPSYYT